MYMTGFDPADWLIVETVFEWPFKFDGCCTLKTSDI